MSEVEAVPKGEIDAFHRRLAKRYPSIYADIWKVGVNFGLRIGDLLSIKYSDIDLKHRQLHLFEHKTGKKNYIRINSSALEVIQRRKEENPKHEWLFQVDCNRAKGKPISRTSVHRVFSDAGVSMSLKVGTHSMRKSRGKAMFDDGMPIEKIARVLNHSSPSTTMVYLGITKEAVLKTYDEYEL